MSSSNPLESAVIKRLGGLPKGDRIMTARAGSAPGELEAENFQSFESLWEDAEAPSVAEVEPEEDPLLVLEEERERIRQECAELVRAAEGRVTKIEKDAYERGFAQGEKAALAKGQEQEAELRQRVELLLAAIQGQRAALDGEYERDLQLLVKSMVGRLLCHEVSVNPLVIQACLKKAMGYVVENSTVRVRLHPEDFNRIKDATLENPNLLEGKCELQLLEDPAISQGGCYLETDFGEVDATLEQRRAAMDKVVDAAFLAALAN